MQNWIDTHTHLDLISKEKLVQKQYVETAFDNKIKKIITISTEITNYINGKNLTCLYPGKVYTTCGLYPSHAAIYNTHLKGKLIDQLNERIAIAVGECGLDYYRNYATHDQQKLLFRDQINLAKEFNLPLVIHARDSYEDVYKILKEESPSGGVMHCFSANIDYAEKFMNLGFYISYAGNITYNKAITLQETCKKIPLDRLLIETDAPYLTPIPYRGKLNHPALITHTAKFISELKLISLEKLSEYTCNNAIQLFNIS